MHHLFQKRKTSNHHESVNKNLDSSEEVRSMPKKRDNRYQLLTETTDYLASQVMCPRSRRITFEALFTIFRSCEIEMIWTSLDNSEKRLRMSS